MLQTQLHQQLIFVQNIEKQTKTTSEQPIFYKYEKFHQTLQNHITHYQLTKNLCYHKPTGILIFASYDQISFYNIAEYSLMTKQIQNSSFCGVSTNDQMLLLAGLTSTVTLINLLNEKVEQFIIVPDGDVIINQADFISDTEILVSDNSQQIRIFDNLCFKDPKYQIKFSCPVNFCAKQNNIIVACLDQREIPILDIRTNQQIFILKRHMENNFVARFNPLNENEFATAGEDKFCYVWDLRQLSSPLKQIKAQGKNFYNLTYTNQGYLICQENSENVQILDNRTHSYIQTIKLLLSSQCVGCVVVDEKFYLSINAINPQFIGILDEANKLSELQKEIDLALVTVGIIEQTTYPFQKSILEQYQSLNQALKNIFLKSILMEEQAIIPKNPQAIRFCDASLGLQATIYNNQVQNSTSLSYSEILKKQDALKELHQKASDHPFLKEKKNRKK